MWLERSKAWDRQGDGVHCSDFGTQYDGLKIPDANQQDTSGGPGASIMRKVASVEVSHF